MMLATQGSIDGGLIALTQGWAINLSGGYHHACKNSGGGFCVYPDISLCIDHL
jgi:histone deacetylase 11